MLITFSSNNLSSQLLKIEQKKYHRIFFPQISTNWFPLSSPATTTFKFRVRFVKKKLLSVLDRIPFFHIKRLSSTNCHDIWPLQMSPITGTNFALGSNVKFKPGFQNPGWKNRARDLGNPSQPTLSYEHIEVRGKLARSWKPGPCEEALSTALKRISFLS